MAFWSNLPSYTDIGVTGIGSIDLRNPLLDLGTIFGIFLQYAFVLAGFVLFAFIIVSGFKYLTSGGNPETMARAKATLTNALIGFLIVISAYWITQIVEIIFGIRITTGTPPELPQPTPTPAISCLSQGGTCMPYQTSLCSGDFDHSLYCSQPGFACCIIAPTKTPPTSTPIPNICNCENVMFPSCTSCRCSEPGNCNYPDQIVGDNGCSVSPGRICCCSRPVNTCPANCVPESFCTPENGEIFDEYSCSDDTLVCCLPVI